MLSRRSVLHSLACGALGSALPAQPRPRKPNFLLIVADDLGYCDVGCYGSPDVPTPHIDSLAKSGVRFTDGYVSAAVCSPSRAALLTGRHQQRFGHEFNNGPAQRDLTEHLGLPLTEVTLPQLLKTAGYRTAMVGKWHLGAAPEFHPMNRGFDEFFGFTTGAASYVTSKTPDAIWTSTEDTPKTPFRERRALPILRGKDPVDEDQYLTDAFAREAVAFLDRVKDQPFFLYLPFNAVHTPLHVLQRYLDRFPSIKDERHRTLAAMTSAMDDAIGAVLNKLRATGQFDNTVIVFISDNGSPTYTRAGSNAPLNGGKITYYEGGIRVPFIIRAPQLKPSVYRHPVVSRDLLPTFLNFAGVPLPKDREYDGVDLMPYLKGEAKAKPHDVLCWRSLPAKAIRKADWKLIEVGDSFTRLYDLSSDIGEKTDLSGQKPEIVKQLRAAYADWESKMVKPKWDVRSSEVVPVNDERIKWSV